MVKPVAASLKVAAASRKKHNMVLTTLHGQELALPLEFFDNHPGGDEILVYMAGRDCTADFEAFGHSESALRWAQSFAVGPAKWVEEAPPDYPEDTKMGFGSRTISALGSLICGFSSKNDELEDSVDPPILALCLLSIASATLAVQLWKV
mmetsp:Transcript_96239/g.281071  ORF Transcript_96239/g.281071 Transcript_96239/m.281071 type:complete len:150 (+) Transcript_96239:79-528(+)